MPALLANLRISTFDRLQSFKKTLNDLDGIFDEYHIKVRGLYAAESIKYAESILRGRIYTYQHLSSGDWLSAAQFMLKNIRSNVVHIFLEDHTRCCSNDVYKKVLTEFANKRLDYMTYSFFRASELDISNILPLGVTQGKYLYSFSLNATTKTLLSKISPRYPSFSLCSIVSKRYLTSLLNTANQPHKIYCGKLSTIGIIFLGYPAYKIVLSYLNGLLRGLNCVLCLYPIDSPHNLEKTIVEQQPIAFRDLVVGVPRFELFANADDDNGAYGESLVKRGRLYPAYSSLARPSLPASPIHNLNLAAKESFNLTYFSRLPRIISIPQVRVLLLSGSAIVKTDANQAFLEVGKDVYFFSTSSPIIIALTEAHLEYQVYDVIFP